MLEFNPFVEYYPGNNWQAKCIRSFHRLISIDPEAHRTRENLKSLTVIKAETLRHLLFYPYTIHCFSRFRYMWEVFMMITYILAFIIIPIHVAFIYEEQRLEELTVKRLVSVINVIYLMDIAINFLSSYQDQQTKKIVLERGRIASKYIRYYFWIDLLSSIPDQMVIYWLGMKAKGNNLDQCIHNSLMQGECLWDIIIIMSLLKFLQVPLFFKYLNDHLEGYQISTLKIKFIKNILSVLFLFHFFVCINFLIIRVFLTEKYVQISESIVDVDFWKETSDVEKYIICFFYTTSTMTLFANAIEEKSQVDLTIAIIFTLIGCVANYWLVSEALMYLTTASGPTVCFQEFQYELMEYVAFKKIPKSTQLRILNYFDFIFKGKFYRMSEMYALNKGQLKHLITNETCQQHLMRNYLFKMLPDGLLHSIASCMRETIYLRNDVICRIDRHRGQKLYFIVYGTVAIYTQDGRELAHLYDGNMFGENEFIHYRDTHTYMNYVAVEECNILVLLRNDFMRIMAENVELINQMRSLLKEKQEENFDQLQQLDEYPNIESENELEKFE
ncbi:hypothetical protein PVAND_007385 [Polypedilum vanderplanki]|uniref:Cyclic nucleotide-binding domain-containing protein n=1 Tax=Polypedilum vanderplanki TaxID=319348 RepID=A0A9J6C652_POLVA|nr:hypothetical protein PVAND_007385 [Polypedilum vanderplanki]